MELFSLFIAAIFINNIVLNRFLGICPFMGVSRKTSSALGMGGAVTFVMVGASLSTYAIYHLILDPRDLQYMDLITFILVIASFVQLTELIIKKFFPPLYKSLGIFLPLITTNCAVLFVALQNISQRFNFQEMVVYAFAVPIGFTLVLYLFSAIRERLDLAKTPLPFKGNPIAMIVAALMALAFSGLAGLV
jgi:electron transport complex protein RnfA